MYKKNIRRLALSLSAFICLTFAACGSGNNEAAVTGDSVQVHRDDGDMSNQQHDGVEKTPNDSMMNQDTTMQPMTKDSSSP